MDGSENGNLDSALNDSEAALIEGRTTRSRSVKPLYTSAKDVSVNVSTFSNQEAPVPREVLSKELIELFPGRSIEIKELVALLGEPWDSFKPLFLYGGVSTGKTSIILEAFRRLKRPFAYTSCRSCHNPRILFESIINQLVGHVRTAANNFSSAKKCDKLGDFVEFLAEACLPPVSRKNGEITTPPAPSKKISPPRVSDEGMNASGNQNSCYRLAGAKCGRNGRGASHEEVLYLIFDNLELAIDWTGGFRLISALLKLSEFTGLSNLGLIFVTSLGPDTFFSGTGTLQPLCLHMRDYTDEELQRILLMRKPHAELYASFLSAVLKPFCRVTRHVTELAEELEPLFQKYLEPIRRGVVKPDEQGKRKLFSTLQPYVNQALNQSCSFSRSFSVSRSVVLLPEEGGWNRLSKKPNTDDHQELHFQLSLCSKYLLVSSFICSRNPATLDATLFDSGGVTSNKRKRKSSQTSLERKELERQEKLLKVPGTFPLERLLAIFQCITADISEGFDEMEVENLTFPFEKHGIELSSDVLMQVSTLVNANLLYKGSSDPLEGAPRYRCNADEELIQSVARTINFPLSRYLYRQ